MSQVKRPCGVCGNDMSPLEQETGLFNHTACDAVPQDIELTSPPAEEERAPAAVFTPVDPKAPACPEPALAKAIRDEFLTILCWAEANRGRSLQVHLGPSELGTECDRQLAYRIMGSTGPNLDMADPWYAFVGSAIHSRMQESVERYQEAHPYALRWAIEQYIQADPLISGHADYNRDQILLDVKSAGKTVMTEVKRSIPHKYRVQGNTYAKGLRDTGRDIRYIVFVFVPRDGKLRDMVVWAEPYDEALALASIARPYRIRDLMVSLDVVNQPLNWEKIPAKPDYMGCQYCPMWQKYAGPGVGADGTACPGYQSKK
jgi:hypothetical protein